ncbi:hypothetical protein [Clostridium algidicarnis]|uniref:hypothetical protein n=1 Tax=Clostridium algidicarnis TaxID=37659 RepID=UPI001C0C2F6A|nr:hypothetical protein [Clostridium algidicarnis]MBU3206790.1 hypothetical protein [Clostridium algidicarnis]
MKKKIIFILLILVVTLSIIGCAKEVSLVETKEKYFIMYSNDNISVKISNTVKDKENIYSMLLEDLQKINEFSSIHKIEIDIDEKHIIPKIEGTIKCNSNFVNTEEFKKELIKKSYDIYDNWISEGLYARIFKEDMEVLEFPEYYEEHDFSLFGARFFEPFASKSEIENVQAASINLVEYIIKKGKKEELLKNQVDISDIEEWGKDKNIDLSYQRSIESLMNRMEANKLNSNVYLTLNTKEDINGFTIELRTIDKQYDVAEELEDFILKMDTSIKGIKEGIKKDAPNFYNDYSTVIENVPKIHYYFDNNSKTQGGAFLGKGMIELKRLSAQAHEFGHILVTDSFLKNSIQIDNMPQWLDEGIVNYLDMAYSGLIGEEMVSDLLEARKDDTVKEIYYDYDKVIEVLEVNDIDLNKLDKIIKDKDERIKIVNIVLIDGIKVIKNKGLEILVEDTVFVKDGYNANQTLRPMDEGNYIDYHLNQIFTNYLIHEYGLEKLLYLRVEDFDILTYEDYFGKGYGELKADWMKYLKENIKAIELIL